MVDGSKLTLGAEVEEWREGSLVGEGGALLAEFVEEGVETGLEGVEALGGGVV